MFTHIDPDHYLQTANGRMYTPERGKAAWHLAYADLEVALRDLGAVGTLYVVCGLQGAGKTTWIANNRVHLKAAVVLDAALPSRVHRQRALSLAAAHGVPAIAVWLDVAIDVALRRNLARPPDEQVPETAIRHVRSLLEPPSVAEGFVRVIEVDQDGRTREQAPA